jgi:hypothetical protein
MGGQKFIIKFLSASEGTLSRWFRLHLQSIAPTNPHWACVVGYGPISLCMIHKEGLYPSSGDIDRLVMKPQESINNSIPFLLKKCLNKVIINGFVV